MIVKGEGEETIADLIGRFSRGEAYSSVEGIVYKVRAENDRIESNPPRSRIRAVNTITKPAWHLFPLQKYFDHQISYGIAYGRSLPILATRGCPYECTFCSSPGMWTTKYVMRDVENVVDEIKHLNSEFGVTNIDFFDLTAIINKRWILEFCAAIKREGLVITWQIPAGTRSEAITYDVAVALKEAGCKNITYAPESGSARTLAAIKKKVTISRMLQSIYHSHRAGLDVKLNIIMGFPDESIADIFKTYLFLVKAAYYGAMDASPAMFSPYPGSALFNELLEQGKVELSDRFFGALVFSESLHHINNYNRYYSKRTITTLLLFSYAVFYGANFLFRPLRAIRMMWNLITHNYQTRGEYMLAEILKRRKAIKRAHPVGKAIAP